MAVTKNNEKYLVRVEYKAAWDSSGLLGLEDYSQTFSNIKESATPEQLHDFAVALMSLTVYSIAPYKVSLIDTSELTVA